MTGADAMDRAVAAAIRDAMPADMADRLRRRCDEWQDFVEADRVYRISSGETPGD